MKYRHGGKEKLMALGVFPEVTLAEARANRFKTDWKKHTPVAPAFPLATAAMAPLRARAEARGSTDFSPLWAGQNTAGCLALPAAQRLRLLMP